MDLQKSCELLLKIEQEVDVNVMSYEGVHLWPLIRQFIWVTSIQRGAVDSEEKNKEFVKDEMISRQKPTILDHFYHIFNSKKITQTFRRSLKALQQSCAFTGKSADICFLSQPIYYSETLNSRPYSRIIDPIYEALCPQHSCLKIEEASQGQILPLREYPCQFFNALSLQANVGTSVLETMHKYGNTLNEISSIASIKDTELTHGLSLGLQTAIKYRDTYSLLLKKIQPKLFFLASYYFPSFMGLNWAASMNNIPTVDLQHGKQGKFQGMYSHWTTIPEQGYALLPTWFWSWGKPSVDNIMKWQSHRKSHRCVIGGYPWISRWKDNTFSHLQFERPVAEKIVLITTQAPVGGLDDFFPDMLVDAMQQSPASWCWIIREHPNYRQGNSVIKDKLKNVDENRYIMDACNKVPLYSLLSECDFHITAYSSVCYEAETFSTPTAIFSEVGRKMYAQEIDDGRFVFCDNSQSLVRAIACFKAKHYKKRYIESDKSVVSSALQIIGKGSGLNLCSPTIG